MVSSLSFIHIMMYSKMFYSEIFHILYLTQNERHPKVLFGASCKNLPSLHIRSAVKGTAGNTKVFGGWKWLLSTQTHGAVDA